MTDLDRRRLLSAALAHVTLSGETSLLVVDASADEGRAILAALRAVRREPVTVVSHGLRRLAVLVLGAAELPRVLGARWPVEVSTRPLAAPEVRVAILALGGVTVGTRLASTPSRRSVA